MIKSTRDVQDVPPIMENESPPEVEYLPASRLRFGERLARNVALAGMLVLAVTAVRNARLPTGQTMLVAVQQMIDSNWDESIGKISFVSSLFPETVSVFFQSDQSASLTAPCVGALAHAWSMQEPYLGYDQANGDDQVYAMAAGQVMSLAHGADEERILRLRQEDGLEALYYNLSDVTVREGDQVTTDTCLGRVLAGKQVVVEVRKEGRVLDPTAWIAARTAAAP